MKQARPTGGVLAKQTRRDETVFLKAFACRLSGLRIKEVPCAFDARDGL